MAPSSPTFSGRRETVLVVFCRVNQKKMRILTVHLLVELLEIEDQTNTATPSVCHGFLVFCMPPTAGAPLFGMISWEAVSDSSTRRRTVGRRAVHLALTGMLQCASQCLAGTSVLRQAWELFLRRSCAFLPAHLLCTVVIRHSIHCAGYFLGAIAQQNRQPMPMT